MQAEITKRLVAFPQAQISMKPSAAIRFVAVKKGAGTPNVTLNRIFDPCAPIRIHHPPQHRYAVAVVGFDLVGCDDMTVHLDATFRSLPSHSDAVVAVVRSGAQFTRFRIAADRYPQTFAAEAVFA